MSKIIFTPAILFTIFLLVIFSGCKKDFDKDKIKSSTWKPEVAVPLVFDSMTFETGISKSHNENHFFIDESGNISILYYYNDNAFKVKVGDLLHLPSYPVTYDHLFTSLEAQSISTQDFVIPAESYTVDLVQNLPGARIDKMIIKNGSIEVNTNNTFSNTGRMTVTFPEATRNGVPFVASLNTFSEGKSTQKIDLSGVSFDFTANPGKMSIVIGGLIKKSSSPTAGDETHAIISLQIDTLKWFEGYLGQRTFDMEEEYVKINLFNNAFAQGTIYIEDPSVSITVISSIGIPARIILQEIKSVNLNSDISYDLGPYLGSGSVFDIPSPLITDLIPVTATKEFNNANTGNQLNPFFNIKPDRIYYKLSTQLNPANTGINFFSDTSTFHSELRANLPLYGYFDNLVIQDTFDFNLSEQKNVENAKIRTKIVNGMPFRARMQVFFTDNNYNKLDSLTGTDNIIIDQPPVDPTTHLPYPGMFGVKDTTFFLDKPRILRLNNQAKKIIVRAIMNSAAGGHELVRIKAKQALIINFSALVKLSADINNN